VIQKFFLERGITTNITTFKEDDMRKLLAPMIVGVVLMLAPVLAIGASLTGSIQGFNCVTQGKVCPIGMEDPVIAAENLFVLLVDAAKGDYYFIPNVDRAVLARHINQQVKVDGTVNAKMKTIQATDIYTTSPSEKKVWSRNWEDRIYNDIMGGNPLGGN
jgi:hypothetical protein